MKNLSLQFSASVNTCFGQHVVICGNIQQLGNWNPTDGLKLFTNQNTYPKWNAFRFIQVKQGTKIEFKACVVDNQGNALRWENLPLNRNRKVIVGTHISIFFFENNQYIEIVAIEPNLEIKNVRKKTVDILNDLESASSQSNQGWQEIAQIGNSKDNYTYFHTFIQSLRNSIESQTSGQIQLTSNSQDLSLKDSICVEMTTRLQHHNCCLVLLEEDTSQQQLESKSRSSTQQELKNSSSQSIGRVNKTGSQSVKFKNVSSNGRKASKPKCKKQFYQQIVNWQQSFQEKKKRILTLHLFLKNEWSIQQAARILELNQFWKSVVHIPDNLLNSYFRFLQLGVNMIVLESQKNLREVLQNLASKGLRANMLKPSLFSLSLGKYCQTLIYCSKVSHQSIVSYLKDDTENPQNQLIKKMNHYINVIPTFPSQSTLVTNILLRKPSIFSQIGQGKISIVVSSENFKQISQKIINFLIKISQIPKHQVFIIHEQKLNDFKTFLPTHWRNKLLALNSAGDIYASLERFSNVFEALKLHKDKLNELYDQIIEQVSGDTHCQCSKTTSDSLIFKTSPDQFGKHIRNLIISLVSKANKKSMIKLTVVHQRDSNCIEVKPFVTCNSFYLKTIINCLKRNKTLGKNMILAVDYSSKQNILNLIDSFIKEDQEAYNIVNYGFFCRKQADPQTGYTRPAITENSLARIFQKMIDVAQDKDRRTEQNYSWVQTPDQTNKNLPLKRNCSSLEPYDDL